MTTEINKRRLSNHSLLILLLGFLLITGLWLYVRYQINNDYNRTIDESSQETMNLATAFEEYTRKIIAEADSYLMNLKKAYEKNDSLSANFITYPLVTSDDSSPSLVAVYNEQGIVVASSNPDRLGVNRSDRDYFLVHREADSQQLNIGKTIKGKVGGEDVIPLTRRINKPDGSFAGIVYTEIKVDHLLAFYQRINLGQDQLIALTGADGFNRARQVGENLETSQDARGSVFWNHVQANITNTSYLSTNIIDGIRRVTSYRVIPEYPLIVVVGKATHVSLADYERRKQGYIIGGLLVSLFILIFCILLVSRYEKNRRLAENILEEKERLAALINSLSDEVWFYDEKERLTLVNSVAAQNFKLSHAEVDGKKIANNFEALRSDWSSRPLEEVPALRALHGEIIRNQHEIIKTPLNGEWRHREVNATAVKDVNGIIIGAVSIVRDITERKRMEEELLKHRDYLEGLVLERTGELENAINNLKIAGNKMAEQSKLLHFAYDYIMVRDLNSRVVFWNQGAEKGYGFTAVEAKGQVTHVLLQTEFPEAEDAILAQLLENGCWEGNLKHTRKDGVQIVVQSNQTLNLDEDGNPVSIMEINHDITAKKKADEKVRDLNLMLQSFNEELENTVAQRTSELQEINATLEEEIMERQASQKALKTLNSELADMNVTLEEEIMERQMVEKSLLKAKEEAERANVAKSKFLANMSHEIRTPMNGIIGMIDITLMTNLQEKQREYLNVVKSSTMALMRVLNDILDYSKIEAGKIELEEGLFDIRETTNEVVDLFTIAAEQKGLSIKLRISEDIPHAVIGDSVRLRQVLSNLVGNGVKFTLQGQIVIDITMEKKHENTVKLMFVVADTGIGISDDKLDKLFKRFSQIDDSHTKQFGGTGLGLAISKKLIEIMSGEIGVESQEGIGSRFFFTAVFGLAKGRSEIIGRTQHESVQSMSPENKKILIAEDDVISRNLGTLILTKNGFQVIEVENGRQAVDAFEQQKFDLILMDVNMPQMDGYTATKMIRAKETKMKFHTPIIAMTAYALKGDREKCLAAGMDDYIPKPIELEKFVELIYKWLRK